jgi:hypothetical protein
MDLQIKPSDKQIFCNQAEVERAGRESMLRSGLHRANTEFFNNSQQKIISDQAKEIISLSEKVNEQKTLIKSQAQTIIFQGKEIQKLNDLLDIYRSEG